MSKIFKIIKFAFFVLVILIGSLSILSIPQFSFGPKMLIVQSGSMEPTLPIGSIVIANKSDNLKVGDIISFRKQIGNTPYVTHRIQRIEDGKILTKVDANNSIDAGYITEKDVVGKAILYIPYLGLIISFIKNPLGIILFIVIPCIIIIFSEIKNIKKEISKKREIKKSAEIALIILSLAFLSQKISSSQSFFTYQATLFRASVNATLKPSPSPIPLLDTFPPPPPSLLSPQNGITRTTTGLVMDWDDETDYLNMHNPVYFIYQSARNSTFTPAAYTSGHLTNSNIPAPGTPNGQYWWHVKACDTLNNCSGWSEPWSITINNNPSPTPSITPALTPTPTPTPTPIQTLLPTEAPTPSLNPSPEITLTPSPSPQ